MKVEYKEILELADYCVEIGVEIKYCMWLGGYTLYFNNGGICAQHSGIEGAENGFVLFSYNDFQIHDKLTLEEAKRFVKENKEFFNRADN